MLKTINIFGDIIRGALVLISIFVYLVAFCGCIDNSKDNGNTINKINEFKVVPADEATFKEFVSKSTAHSYEYYNILGGFNTASRGVAKGSDLPVSESAISTDSYGVERYSETNVQVKGIDEADIVKTDGNYIYFTPPGRSYCKIRPKISSSYGIMATYIIDALPPESAKVINKISEGGTLYLYNDNLIIIDYGNDKILNYNVSNPKNPILKWEKDLNGSYVDSRVYNGKLYLIVSKFDYIVCPIIWNDVKINYNKYYIPIVPNTVSGNFDRTYIISSHKQRKKNK
ncbi:beta-propeller domain-containing protein [Methanothermococcus sp.]|uniref:beta-propeller domain-containing protein n=1 Tax=Methanothermococcus sp. TaxID=2614238 RepID=UPI0025FC6356|nr:beta-propeller domain-containing protein [Methanothermococcus sp.]